MTSDFLIHCRAGSEAERIASAVEQSRFLCWALEAVVEDWATLERPCSTRPRSVLEVSGSWPLRSLLSHSPLQWRVAV